MTVPEQIADQQVLADWAVRSKHPGRSMGYELLTASGNRKRAERIIWDSGTGTPQDERTGKPDALPWLTFTGDVEDGAVVGVVQRSWSDALDGTGQPARDGTGQPIVPARLVALPWPDQPLVGPGFLGLFRVMRALTWSGATGPPTSTADGAALSIAVPPMDVDQLSELIDKIGFEWLLNIAVALLDGQQVVIIMPIDPFPLDQRVAILDAACGLLPYGCRSWISAATWANDRSEHGVRLTFAATARSGQCEISYTAPTAIRLRSPAAANYQRVMTQLRSAGVATSTIVAHLATLHEPLLADQAELAVKHLDELRLPEAVHDEILRNAGDPLRVERVLRRLGWHRLPVPMRADYVRFLAGTGSTNDGRGAQARQILGQYWTTDTCEALADAASRELATVDARRPQAWLSTVSAPGMPAPGALAAVSAAILRRAASLGDLRQAENTLTLLRNTPGSLHAGNPDAWRVLANHAELGARFLRDDITDLRAGGRRFWDHLDALNSHATTVEGRWLSLVSAVAQRRRLSDAELAPGGAVDPNVLLLLLDLAVTTNQVGYFVTVAWPYLLQLAFPRSTDGSAGHLTAIQETLSSCGLDHDGVHYPFAMVVVDILSLSVTGTMPYLTSQPGDDLPADYLPALRRVWHAPVLESKRNQLADQLPTAVLNRVLDARSFTRLVAIVEEIDPQRLPVPAVRAVADHLEHNPDLLLTLPMGKWWQDQFVSSFVWLNAYFRLLNYAQDPATLPQVLYDHYRALRGRGASIGVAMRAMSPWLQVNGVRGLTCLLALDTVRGRKDKLELPKGSHGHEIYDAVQNGALGPDIAREFSYHVRDQYQIFAALHEFDQARQRSRPRQSRSSADNSARPADNSANPAAGSANPEEPSKRGGFKVVPIFGWKKE